jgi:hypothetical protein
MKRRLTKLHLIENNYKILKKIPEGINLDFNLYNQFKEDIFSNYSSQDVNFIKYLFEILSKNFMPYISLLNIFKFHFPREISKTTISTAKKDPSGDETSGKSGLSHPHAVQKGGRGREDTELRGERMILGYGLVRKR